MTMCGGQRKSGSHKELQHFDQMTSKSACYSFWMLIVCVPLKEWNSYKPFYL